MARRQYNALRIARLKHFIRTVDQFPRVLRSVAIHLRNNAPAVAPLSREFGTGRMGPFRLGDERRVNGQLKMACNWKWLHEVQYAAISVSGDFIRQLGDVTTSYKLHVGEFPVRGLNATHTAQLFVDQVQAIGCTGYTRDKLAAVDDYHTAVVREIILAQSLLEELEPDAPEAVVIGAKSDSAQSEFLPTDSDRDRWIYDRVNSGAPYCEIKFELQQMAAGKKWLPISSEMGILKRARQYAKDWRLPAPPARKRGRRATTGK